jgi:hypothetical protein
MVVSYVRVQASRLLRRELDGPRHEEVNANRARQSTCKQDFYDHAYLIQVIQEAGREMAQYERIVQLRRTERHPTSRTGGGLARPCPNQSLRSPREGRKATGDPSGRSSI